MGGGRGEPDLVYATRAFSILQLDDWSECHPITTELYHNGGLHLHLMELISGHETHRCHYAVAGYHRNELSIVNTLNECKLRSTTWTNEQSFTSVYRVYSVSNTIFWSGFVKCKSRDRVVGIATGYGLDDRGVGVQVPIGSRIFSPPRRPDRLWRPPNFPGAVSPRV
jgi:hypothetical protein